MRRQGYGDGIGMQCFQEAVAYFRLRNQREEQRQMHITNGNIPAKIRAGSKLKKAPTPNMTKVKVVSVLEAQQMPKASHTYDTLRHKNAKRMNEIASMPCHEIFPAIEKWRQERPTSESNDASLVPPRPPAGRADEAEAEFQPVLSRRKVKAAKREANLAAKRKLDAAHWNAPILTAPPVRGVEGVYLANNSADAEALVAGGLFDGYTFAGKLAVLFLGTPSDSLLSSAQQHHINPVPCSIPVMKGVGTYVETGFVWQIGAQEVKSLIVPLEVNWSTTQQPTIVAVDVACNHASSQLWGRLSQAWKSVVMSREHEEWKKQQQKLGKKPWQALNEEMTARFGPRVALRLSMLACMGPSSTHCSKVIPLPPPFVQAMPLLPNCVNAVAWMVWRSVGPPLETRRSTTRKRLKNPKRRSLTLSLWIQRWSSSSSFRATKACTSKGMATH